MRSSVKSQMSKDELLGDLRDLLLELLTRQRFGGDGPSLARAHGYVDGFMRVLLDTGIVSQAEMLELVASQRERVDGPARRVVVGDVNTDSAERAA